MMGKDVSQSDLDSSCDSALTVTDGAGEELILSPCGLIAKSYFTDSFTAQKNSGSGLEAVTMNTDKITGPLDQSLFQQPKDFETARYTAGPQCNSGETLSGAQCIGIDQNQCTCFVDSSGQSHVYYYPNDETTQYLHETYAGLVSPLVGVTDPRFMNWMNIAALPKFRKLYGIIDGNYKEGDTLKISVSYPVGSGAPYDVNQFSGTKSVVLSAKGALGVRNPGLGVTYIVSGACMVIMALVFFIKHEISPRPLGSAAMLNWTR